MMPGLEDRVLCSECVEVPLHRSARSLALINLWVRSITREFATSKSRSAWESESRSISRSRSGEDAGGACLRWARSATAAFCLVGSATSFLLLVLVTG